MSLKKKTKNDWTFKQREWNPTKLNVFVPLFTRVENFVYFHIIGLNDISDQ